MECTKKKKKSKRREPKPTYSDNDDRIVTPPLDVLNNRADIQDCDTTFEKIYTSEIPLSSSTDVADEEQMKYIEENDRIFEGIGKPLEMYDADNLQVCDKTVERITAIEITSSSIDTVHCPFDNDALINVIEENDKKLMDKLQKPVEMEHVIDLPSAPALEQQKYPNLTEMKALSQLDNTFIIQQHVSSKSQLSVDSVMSGECELFVNRFFNMVENQNIDYNTRNRLYDLLMKYSHALLEEQVARKKIDVQIEDAALLSVNIWDKSKTITKQQGQCCHGVQVTASHMHDCVELNKDKQGLFRSSLTELRRNVYNVYISKLYKSEVIRLEIEQYLQSLLVRSKSSDSVSPNITLQPADTEYSDLRISISVLFYFQRRSICHPVFIKHSREWLTSLTVQLLSVANAQDHLFLLSHILRCPPGVTKWAANFVQCPPIRTSYSFNSNYNLQFAIAMLRLLLSNAHDRKSCLQHFYETFETSGTSGQSADTAWVVVDSDGEDDGPDLPFKESDLINLINQIPLHDLFRAVLMVEKDQQTGKLSMDKSFISIDYLKRLLTFATMFVCTLAEGLKNYTSIRYKTLSKHLGRIIKHVIQYVWSMIKIFKENNWGNHTELHCEFEALCLRGIHAVYSAKREASFQILAAMPFEGLSINASWAILYHLCVRNITYNWGDDIKHFTEYKEMLTTQVTEQFQDDIASCTGNDVHFILETLSNMILGHSQKDIDFVLRVTFIILQIGFINKRTLEECGKTSRSMLSEITTLQPHILSSLLDVIKNNLVDVSNGVFIFQEMPVQKWLITTNDFQTLAAWLMNSPIQSHENCLSRLILSRLNWGLDRTGELFLPHALHYDVGTLVVKAAIKWTEAVTSPSTLINDGFKHVSGFVRAVKPEQRFHEWVWRMLQILKLHRLDISDKVSRLVMSSPSSVLYDVPDYRNVEHIADAVNNRNPIATFFVIQATTTGHSVPIIYLEGFDRIMLLIDAQKYDAAIKALFVVTPLLMDSTDNLVKSETFMRIITSLTHADQGSAMAKFKMSQPAIGPVSVLMNSMIQVQILNYERYNLFTPEPLIVLWLRCITTVPNWNIHPTTIYLLNRILKVAFSYRDAWYLAVGMLEELVPSVSMPSSNFHKLLNWVSSSTLPVPTPLEVLTGVPFFALCLLEAEHSALELKTGLWHQLLNQLVMLKLPIETALEQSCANCNVPVRYTSSLVIYRLANVALQTPKEHVLAPILWQAFFQLLLGRFNSAGTESCAGKVFLEDFIKSGLSQKIKQQLEVTVLYYKDAAHTSSEDCERAWNISVARIFSAYLLWFTTAEVYDVHFITEQLGPHFLSSILKSAIFTKSHFLYQYVNVESIKKEQKDDCKEYYRTCSQGYNMPVTDSTSRTAPIIEEEIFGHLNSYEAPQLPPVSLVNLTPLPYLSYIALSDTKLMHKELEKHYVILRTQSCKFLEELRKHSDIETEYLQTCPQLYEFREKTVLYRQPCGSLLPTSKACAGPARIEIRFLEPEINPVANEHIVFLQSELEMHIKLAMQYPPPEMASSLAIIAHTVNEARRLHVNEEQLFIWVLNVINAVTSYTPVCDILEPYLEHLGQVIKDFRNEGYYLIKQFKDCPESLMRIIPYVSCSNIDPDAFVSMYRMVATFIHSNMKIQTISSLYEKVDLQQWLSMNPLLEEKYIAQILQHIIKILGYMENFKEGESETIIKNICTTHIGCIIEYQFPSYFWAVINTTFEVHETGKPNMALWAKCIDILLNGPKGNSGHNQITLPFCKDDSINTDQSQYIPSVASIIKILVTHQNHVDHLLYLHSAAALKNRFDTVRLNFGLHGLYPKYRNYLDPLVVLNGAVSFGIIVSAISVHPGLVSDYILEQIWPVLLDIWMPWLIPFVPNKSTERPANWITELTNNTVLFPWSPNDTIHATKMVCMFVETIKYAMDVLPASKLILSLIWGFYVNYFANVAVPLHVLQPVHKGLLHLRWDLYKPIPKDIDKMHKLCTQFLPENHSFLAQIFLNIPWESWCQYLIVDMRNPIYAQSKGQLLELIVMLAYEPSIKESSAMIHILKNACHIPWWSEDAINMGSILDRFIMTVDCSFLLKCEARPDHNSTDEYVFKLLQSACAVNKEQQDLSVSQSMILSRQISFTCAFVRLLENLESRFALLLKNSKNSRNCHEVIVWFLDILHNLAVNNGVRKGEILILKCISMLNTAKTPDFALLTKSAVLKWLEQLPRGDGLLESLLRIFHTVSDETVKSELVERTIATYFLTTKALNESVPPTWKEITDNLDQTHLLLTPLLDGNLYLSLHAYFLKLLEPKRPEDMLTALRLMVNTLNPLRPTNSNAEAIFTLLWSDVLFGSAQLMNIYESQVAELLLSFVNLHLEPIGNLAQVGLLSYVLKRDTASNSFKILARILSAFILCQMPMLGSQAVLRKTRDAPGHYTCIGDMERNPGLQVVLESLEATKQELTECGLTIIKDPLQSLASAVEMWRKITRIVYTDTVYL